MSELYADKKTIVNKLCVWGGWGPVRIPPALVILKATTTSSYIPPDNPFKIIRPQQLTEYHMTVGCTENLRSILIALKLAIIILGTVRAARVLWWALYLQLVSVISRLFCACWRGCSSYVCVSETLSRMRQHSVVRLLVKTTCKFLNKDRSWQQQTGSKTLCCNLNILLSAITFCL